MSVAVSARRTPPSPTLLETSSHAPYAYKAVEPVVDSVETARVARKVARLFPLLTVKG